MNTDKAIKEIFSAFYGFLKLLVLLGLLAFMWVFASCSMHMAELHDTSTKSYKERVKKHNAQVRNELEADYKLQKEYMDKHLQIQEDAMRRAKRIYR